MKHREWTAEDRKKVLWTDESKYKIFSSTHRILFTPLSRRNDGSSVCDIHCQTWKRKRLVWGFFCRSQGWWLVQNDSDHSMAKQLPGHSAAPCTLWYAPSWAGVQIMTQNISPSCARTMVGKKENKAASLKTWSSLQVKYIYGNYQLLYLPKVDSLRNQRFRIHSGLWSDSMFSLLRRLFICSVRPFQSTMRH